MTCCRRSASYWRVMTLPRRAVAFQSMCRRSSPGTHSRSDSNNRPSPKRRRGALPCSWRRCARATDARSRTVTSGGYTATSHGSAIAPRRRPSPSGPAESTANPTGPPPPSSRPRRSGRTVTVSRASPCGGTMSERRGWIPPSRLGRTSRTSSRARRALEFIHRYDTSPPRPTENAGGASRTTRSPARTVPFPTSASRTASAASSQTSATRATSTASMTSNAHGNRRPSRPSPETAAPAPSARRVHRTPARAATRYHAMQKPATAAPSPST